MPLPFAQLFIGFGISSNFVVKPVRPGLSGSGTEKLPLPVAGLTENFSPMPRMAPPPVGSGTCGNRLVTPVGEAPGVRPEDATLSLASDGSALTNFTPDLLRYDATTFDESGS